MNARFEAFRRRRASCAWLGVAASLAVASLPLAEFSASWILALLLPAGAVAAVRGTERWPVWRAVLLTALQVGACLAAVELHGPLPRPLALAATLLPPLAFVVVRRQDSDRALGAFLSLCVLLVGAILQPVEPWLVVAFAIAAANQLACDARLRVLDLCSDAPTVPAAAAAHRPRSIGLSLGLLVAVVAAALQQLLVQLPSPTRNEQPVATSGTGTSRRSPGLSDSFELGGDGTLSNLRGDHLVTVRRVGGGPMPSDLYLRSGFFQSPGLDAWQVGTLQQRVADSTARPVLLRQPPDDAPRVRLQLSRTQAARDLVFVAPGTFSLLGIPDVGYDAAREWFRQTSPGHLDDYEIQVADQVAEIQARPAPRELLFLPPSIEAKWFEPLLESLPRNGDALAIAQAVAAMLQQRCRYERREPGGPHEHALLNFLHGERIGYCMHFASAAAILLRMRGVPCRIGVGLYGGEAGDRGTRRYGSQHAHAWVEIPLVGGSFGVFDPTPPSLRGTVPETADTAVGAADDAATETGPSLGELLLHAAREHWPWLVVAALLLALLHGRTQDHRVTAPAPRAARPARRLIGELLAELARRGHVRPFGSTLEQYASILQLRGAAAPALQRAFAAYQEIRFGGRELDAEREQRLRDGLACARELPKPSTSTAR